MAGGRTDLVRSSDKPNPYPNPKPNTNSDLDTERWEASLMRSGPLVHENHARLMLLFLYPLLLFLLTRKISLLFLQYLPGKPPLLL